MAVEYVRVSMHANALKKQVSDILGKKVKSLNKDMALKNQLAREYGWAVTPYVPRSNISKAHHHLQTFYVSDGRVKWTRFDNDGDEIAGKLYYGPIRGKFHVRDVWPNNMPSDYINAAGGHHPTGGWDTMVTPSGGSSWSMFVLRSARLIKEKMHFD